MVLQHSKKLLLIVVVVLLMLCVITGIYLLVIRDDKKNDISPVQTQQEINKVEGENNRLNELALVANSGDSDAALKASKEFARNPENNITSRLDSYRLCIQGSITLSDNTSKDECYNEGITLADTFPREEQKNYWKEYLLQVYEGRVREIDEAEDGSQ